MDRNRLKEVHTSDLTESRLNEDFLTWLQTKGPTYLLVILIFCCGYVFYVRYQASESSYERKAWSAFRESQLPSSFEDVAREYGDVGAVAPLARMQAAQMLLNSVQSGTALSPDGNNVADLTPTDRTNYLERADALFVLVSSSDDQTDAMAALVVGALNGRAAVAESNGDLDAARAFYEAAATRAESRYPALAAQARKRIETIDAASSLVSFPTNEQLAAQPQPTQTELIPISILDALKDRVGPTADR